MGVKAYLSATSKKISKFHTSLPSSILPCFASARLSKVSGRKQSWRELGKTQAALRHFFSVSGGDFSQRVTMATMWPSQGHRPVQNSKTINKSKAHVISFLKNKMKEEKIIEWRISPTVKTRCTRRVLAAKKHCAIQMEIEMIFLLLF
ncbi:hypothetical protein, unlikely [Trypanosoma congolense IL3000]|uniref:Uncharacterized protein n=1 Tax=Trypanosoma congolense (strain IL3000) TaxID=1068625 RepID=F9WE19_TRYCI|nr:hypothetical protein, unlikely [Trypanosoma congolense IL3000]